ncbi:Uncharacterised protein [[Clostridium] sordellii]|nr:Uncharacterised protein [[Clostridium] sordellii] [Paeniclostridium sordellii]
MKLKFEEIQQLTLNGIDVTLSGSILAAVVTAGVILT